MGLIDGLNAPEDNIVITSLEVALNWGRSNSLWPFTMGLACCAIEMICAGAARYDIARFGSEVFRATPRQADLMIVAGTVTYKMAARVKKLYEQMPDPRYVIAMGSCAISGGIHGDSYCVLRGIDKIIPVDVYIPGCPPRPDALFDGLLLLQKKIRTEKLRKNSEKYILKGK